MLRRTFWTHQRFTGLLLILGCFLFLGATGLIPRDALGNFIANLPLRERLLVIAAHATPWQWSLGCFISGVMVTALGFALLTRLLWDAVERNFSHLALIASPFGIQRVIGIPWHPSVYSPLAHSCVC